MFFLEQNDIFFFPNPPGSETPFTFWCYILGMLNSIYIAGHILILCGPDILPMYRNVTTYLFNEIS